MSKGRFDDMTYTVIYKWIEENGNKRVVATQQIRADDADMDKFINIIQRIFDNGKKVQAPLTTAKADEIPCEETVGTNDIRFTPMSRALYESAMSYGLYADEPRTYPGGKLFAQNEEGIAVFKGLDGEIRSGYVGKRYDTHPAPVKITRDSWSLFGKHGISHITFHDDSFWHVEYTNDKSITLEPQFTRAFLDAIGLTEDKEPRIGNQESWDEVLSEDEDEPTNESFNNDEGSGYTIFEF